MYARISQMRKPDADIADRSIAHLTRAQSWGLISLDRIECMLADLFSTSNVPLTGYKKMLWLVGKLDGHGRIRDGIPGDARIANQFREHNPQTPIRVGLFDTPMTHYGYMEMPKQLAAGMVAGLKWLVEP